MADALNVGEKREVELSMALFKIRESACFWQEDMSYILDKLKFVF